MSLSIERSPLESPSDRSLAEALARGDREAVETLYRELCDPLYAFVFHRVGGDRSDAEDVTQETFLTALREAHGFEARSTLRTWVFGIAKNKARERLRARRRERSRRLDERGGEVERALAQVETTDLPAAVIEAEETARLVGTALAHLPAGYRQTLTEKYVAGRTLAEIARRQSRSPKAVESSVQRARRAFARMLRVLAASAAGEESP